MKIFLTTKNPLYLKLIPDAEETNNLKEADLVIFTGGPDVDPSYYNESSHKWTSTDWWRDPYEFAVFFNAVQLNIPMLGICRGAQLLTVANGGKLVQHVNNHGLTGTHRIYFDDGSKPIQITSTHHQMMYPFKMKSKNYELIAYAKGLSDQYWKNREELYPDIVKEPEIVYYPNNNCLCIQGHPERLLGNKKTLSKIRSLIKDKLNVQFNLLPERRLSSLSVA